MYWFEKRRNQPSNIRVYKEILKLNLRPFNTFTIFFNTSTREREKERKKEKEKEKEKERP